MLTQRLVIRFTVTVVVVAPVKLSAGQSLLIITLGALILRGKKVTETQRVQWSSMLVK